MAVDEIVGYVFSFLGGGFVAALGNWLHANRAAQTQQELTQLRDQLKFLYGPAYFLTQWNEQLFKLVAAVHGAYDEFLDKEWSGEPGTQERVQKSGVNTLELGNAYVDKVIENNKNLLAILQDNWHLVDAEDIQDFSKFQVDCTRFATEVSTERYTMARSVIRGTLGDISFMRSALIRQVAKKVAAKQSRIDDLLRPWWRRRPSSDNDAS